MPFHFTPATISALAKLVQVLDLAFPQHRFGAVMLILVMVTAGGLMTIPFL